jgi:hypothetical protein
MSWRSASGYSRSGLLTVLDVGTSKVCCIIARLKPREESQHLPGRTHHIRIAGIGHQKSLGVKSGTVVEIAQKATIKNQGWSSSSAWKARMKRRARLVVKRVEYASIMRNLPSTLAQ